jgi:hypothetical protein
MNQDAPQLRSLIIIRRPQKVSELALIPETSIIIIYIYGLEIQHIYPIQLHVDHLNMLLFWERIQYWCRATPHSK